MKEIIMYKRINSTTSMGEGITLTHSFYSFNPEDIDKLECLFREKIKTALIVDTVMTDPTIGTFLDTVMTDLGEQNERTSKTNDDGSCRYD